MEIALSREVGFFDFVEFGFDVLGMAEHAEFVQVKQDFDAYIASERNKLLRVACGEIGFAIWKPQADTCNEI